MSKPNVQNCVVWMKNKKGEWIKLNEVKEVTVDYGTTYLLNSPEWVLKPWMLN